MPKIVTKTNKSLISDWRKNFSKPPTELTTPGVGLLDTQQLQSSTMVSTPNRIKSETNRVPIVKGDPTPKYINIKDNRKIRATTGLAIDPNRDLKTGSYPTTLPVDIAGSANTLNKDAWTVMAIGLAENDLDKKDSFSGHMTSPPTEGATSPGDDMVRTLSKKMQLAKRLGYKDEPHQIQAWQGLSHKGLTAKSDQKYNIETGQGSSQGSWFGVPIPSSGHIDTFENPLYGKEIIDLRDNVLKPNKDLKNIVDTTGTKGGVVINNGIKYTNSIYARRLAVN